MRIIINCDDAYMKSMLEGHEYPLSTDEEDVGVDTLGEDEYSTLEYAHFSLPILQQTKAEGRDSVWVLTPVTNPENVDMTQTFLFLGTEDSGEVLLPFNCFDKWSNNRVYCEKSYENDTWGDPADQAAKSNFKDYWKTGNLKKLQQACWSGEDQCPGFYMGVFTAEKSSVDDEIAYAEKHVDEWDEEGFCDDCGGCGDDSEDFYSESQEEDTPPKVCQLKSNIQDLYNFVEENKELLPKKGEHNE